MKLCYWWYLKENLTKFRCKTNLINVVFWQPTDFFWYLFVFSRGEITIEKEILICKYGPKICWTCKTMTKTILNYTLKSKFQMFRFINYSICTSPKKAAKRDDYKTFCMRACYNPPLVCSSWTNVDEMV